MTVPPSRRDFMRHAAMFSGSALTQVSLAESAASTGSPKARPNILMICADQFRADFVGANGANPTVRTPHLDALCRRGVNFQQAVCNQPLCSPSRASFLTSRTATETGVWRLGIELDHSVPTIATVLRQQGYTTAMYGKWHLASTAPPAAPSPDATRSFTGGTLKPGEVGRGLVPAGPARGGFDDVFEGSNVPEIVSQPYEGNYWDTAGKNIGYKDIYRPDFITERSLQFIRQAHSRPWLLFVSQLEPHQQNDVDMMVPPKRYEDSYIDPFVAHDLRPLPGNWQSRLPGYYGCVNAIDDCVGRLMEALTATGQIDNTVVVFFSDHGCTFRTRIGEYKRSPHESSLRVPLVFAGPGFTAGTTSGQPVSLIDLMPTLLDAAGVTGPASMRGKSLLSLLHEPGAGSKWPSEVYIQISESVCGRAIRTPDWVYCAYDPTAAGGEKAGSTKYTDFALYSLAGDPFEQVNLIGRPEFRNVANGLRERLRQMIVAHGEAEPVITPVHIYA